MIHLTQIHKLALAFAQYNIPAIAQGSCDVLVIEQLPIFKSPYELSMTE